MALTWADKRRVYIIGGFVLTGLVLLSGILIAVLYKAPSCGDGVLNQDETGIDCGGSCAFLCKVDVDVPRVTFARAIANNGRTDVIAYIENRNRAAEAKDAAYTVEVYDDTGTLLGKREGMIDLPARATVPIYIPGIAQSVSVSPRAFVTFDEDMRWRTARTGEAEASVSNVEIISGAVPRVTATLSNPSPTARYDRIVIATVFAADGIAIAASRTVVREIPGLGQANVIFTWNEPFGGIGTRVEIEVLPVLP